MSERWRVSPSLKLKPRSALLPASDMRGLPAFSEKRASTRDGLVKLRDFVISSARSDGIYVPRTHRPLAKLARAFDEAPEAAFMASTIDLGVTAGDRIMAICPASC